MAGSRWPPAIMAKSSRAMRSWCVWESSGSNSISKEAWNWRTSPSRRNGAKRSASACCSKGSSTPSPGAAMFTCSRIRASAFGFTWRAPSEDEAQTLYASTLDTGASGFFPDTVRKGWREQPPKMKEFTTEDGALTVSLIDGVFEKHQAKDQDERGRLYLFARYQKEKDNRKNADDLGADARHAGGSERVAGSRAEISRRKKARGEPGLQGRIHRRTVGDGIRWYRRQ